MDAKEAFLRIAENESKFGKCDADTAANLINNEDSLDIPITSFMYDPSQTNPNGSIKINQTRKMLENGNFDGAAQTLANARLYAFYKPVEQELFQKEEEYKKALFDAQGFFAQFGNNYMYNKYSLERSGSVYRMAKAQQEGDLNTVMDEQYKIAELDKKLKQYIQPSDNLSNSTANLVASMARNAPETLAVAVGAGIITAATGGTATAAFLATAGSTVLNGSIIYNDTFDLEAGEMYESLADSSLSEEERLRLSENSARISAGIEASSAIFGVAGMGARAATKGAAVLSKTAAKGLAKKTAKELAARESLKKITAEFTKKGIGEKLKDPKYIAYVGKRTAEHILASGAEGLQEVSQELIKDAYINAINDAENPENELTIKNIFNVLGDGSETSKYGSLFLNTALASLLISGTGATATTGVKTGYQKLLARSMEKMNIDQVGDNIIKQKENSQAYQKSPKAYSENTRAIIDAGNAPEKATVNTGTLLDILDDAEKNGKTNILQKLTQMGVSRESLEKDVTLTGQTNIDFQKFDEIALDPKDPELYQKIRGNWTTDDTTLTGKEMQVLVNDMLAKRPELAQAVNDQNSVFNIVLEGLQKNKNFTPKMALANAQLAQMATNRAMTFEGVSDADARKIALSVINTKQSLLDKAKNIFDEVKTKVVEARDTKQVESIAGEYASMLGQQVSDFHKRFATAIVQKDFKSLSELLLAGRGMNENSKKMFEKATGKKLPKTIKEREQFLVEWAGHDYEKYLEEKKAAQKTEAIERERREKKERLSGYIKELEESLVNDSGKIISKKEFIDSLVEEGRHLETKKVGINNVYRLVDDNGYYAEFKKKSEKEYIDSLFEATDEDLSGLFGEKKLYSKTQDQQIAGVFSKEMGEYIIKLTEAANPTTFMHEFNHLVVTDMIESFNGGKMTPYWQKQTMKIADFVGAKPINGKLTFTEEQFERVAEAFTTYLKEGRPPVEGLRDVFNRMAEWFIDVYKKLVMAKVPLNKSIRSAFDALLVSQEEIDQAIIDKNLRAIGRRDWITEDEYQGYISDLSSLSRVSTNKHIEAIRKKMRIAIQEKNKAKMEEIQKDIDAKVNSRPEYLFENAVLNTKINLASIPEGYKIKNKKYVSEKEGLPVAEFINTFPDLVSNVADVVGLLNNLEDKQTVIENETREAFNEWLDKEYEGKKEFIEADAKLATANEKLIDVRVKEYLMLNKIPLSQFNQYRQELIRAVNREVKNMQLRELTNLERWQNLEVKIVTKARFAKSDSELANSLWHQAAVNQIIIRAKEIKSQVYKFNKHFNKYRYLPTKDALKTIDAYDFDLVTAVLRNIGFTKKHPRIRDISVANRLENWIEEKTAKSFSTAESVRSYIPTLNRETGVKFDKNTYGDFAVFDVLSRLIEGISMSDKVKTEEAGRQLRQEDVNSVAEFIAKKKITKISSAFTDFTMVAEQLLKKILPEKVFNEYVLPYMQAHTLREQRISKMDKLLYNALENTLKNRERSIAITLPSGEVFNMTYEQLQVAVLNIDNMETWLATFNKENKAELDEDAFLSIIEQAPEQMLIDARTIWDIFDSQKAEFRDAQYKVDGFLMDYVEPRSITLSDGRTIQSGYFPRGKKPVGKNGFTETIKPTNIDGVYTFGTSRYAKDRLSASHNELDLTINSIRSWMYHTATVIEIGPAFNKLQKLFDNETINNAFGEKAIDYFNRWMEYSVVGDSVNKFFSSVDKLASVQILGYTPIKLITQAIGFIPALNETGMLWGLPQLFNPKNIMNLFNVSFAKQLSPYMRERYDNAINHLASISKPNQIFASAERTTDKIMNYLMYFIIHGDAFASSIVWNGAYNKAIAQGKNSEQATLIADSAVRRTQGDSSVASRAEAMRGNKRFMTKFASYFISVNSRFTSALIGKDYVEAVSVAMLAGVLAPVLESMIRTAVDWEIGDDDDKKKWRKLKIHSFEDLMYYNIKSNVATTIGSSAIPTLGIGAFSANVLATGQAFKNPLPMIEYLNNLAMAGLYPIRAAVVETEAERRKLLKQAKKSALKVLTVPNKLSKMIVE